MNKNFIKKYQRRLFRHHSIIAFSLLILMIALLYIQNKIFSGVVIDFISDLFGYDTAVNVLRNKTTIIVLGVCIILFVSWIFVEIQAVRKLGQVINELNIMFEKDGTVLSLDDDFIEIERSFNDLKLQNIRNEHIAKQEEQREKELIAYLAHDIKTPLSSVIGYLNLLDDNIDMSQSQREKYTKIALNKANRVEQLINEFFDITRFNASAMKLNKENISLNFMLEQMADEFYPILNSNGRSIVLQIQPDLNIYADPDKLARVVNNIIKNAIAYSNVNSAITIEGKQEANIIILKISNEGETIPREKLNIIFDKFYRLDSARSSNTGGAGLGLAIAKEIVKAHKGTIAVESDEIRTCFTIEIPKWIE